MDKLVFAGKEKREVGKFYRGIEYGPWCEPEPEQCFKVVAVASEQDWIDCIVSFRGEEERSWAEILAKINGPWLYYEIQTD